MKDVFDTLNRIKDELGATSVGFVVNGSNCVIVRVYWDSGSTFAIEHVYSDLEFDMDGVDFVERFIFKAKSYLETKHH